MYRCTFSKRPAKKSWAEIDFRQQICKKYFIVVTILRNDIFWRCNTWKGCLPKKRDVLVSIYISEHQNNHIWLSQKIFFVNSYPTFCLLRFSPKDQISNCNKTNWSLRMNVFLLILFIPGCLKSLHVHIKLFTKSSPRSACSPPGVLGATGVCRTGAAVPCRAVP